MGLLDFISKNTGDDSKTQAAGDQQQTQSGGYSDIQYPIPQGTSVDPSSSVTPVSAPTNTSTTQVPQQDISAYTYNTGEVQAQEFTQQPPQQQDVLSEESLDITQGQSQFIPQAQEQNQIEDLSKYAQQSSTTNNYSLPETNNQGAENFQAYNSIDQHTPQPPQQQDFVQAEPPKDIFDGNVDTNFQQSNQNIQGETNNMVEPPKPENFFTEDNSGEISANPFPTEVPSYESVSPSTAESSSTEVSQIGQNDDIFFNDVNTQGDVTSPQQSVATTVETSQPDIPTSTTSEGIVEEGPVRSPEEELVVGIQQADEDVEVVSGNQDQYKPQSEEIHNLDTDNKTTDGTNEEETVGQVDTPIQENIKEATFTKVQNVAFLSLNSRTFNNVSSEIKSLVNTLTKNGVNILVDSNKGYGSDILSELDKVENASLTAVYLKPFFSSYTDEGEKTTSIQDLTTVFYSDYIERIKYFIREAEAFVIPETTGLLNWGTLSLLLSIQFLYSGQHKPVILLGNKWQTKLEQFKTLSGMSDDEFQTLNIAQNANEVLTILTQLDEDNKSNNKSRSRKFLDFREDFDEYEYLIN